MPLSEQEQRLLEEMERSLYQNDADFVPTTRTAARTPQLHGARRRRAHRACSALRPSSSASSSSRPWIGILGFVVMFVGVLLAVAPPRRMTSPESKPTAGPAPRGHRPNNNSESFMDRLNERWDKRQDGRE